jgi:hypothetical protein
MQKKKTPVAAISFIALVFVAFAMGNITGFFNNPAAFFQPKPQAPPEAPEEKKETEKPKPGNELAKAQAERARTMGPNARRADGEADGVPPEPSILFPKVNKFKPTVNDSNISAQWYREESRQKERAARLERERQAASGT